MLSPSSFYAVFDIILAVVSSETVSKIVWQSSEQKTFTGKLNDTRSGIRDLQWRGCWETATNINVREQAYCERSDCSNEHRIFMVMKAPRAVFHKSSDVKIQQSTKFCHIFSSQDMPYLVAIWCAILPSLYFMDKGALSAAERADFLPICCEQSLIKFPKQNIFWTIIVTLGVVSF